MRIKLIIILVAIIFTSACVNEATTIGNPPAPLPTPIDGGHDGGDDGDGNKILTDPAGFTEGVIDEHKIWEDDYFVEFANEGNDAYVYSMESDTYVELEYTIQPDGSIQSSGEDNSISLIGYIEEKDEELGLTLKLISDTNDVLADLDHNLTAEEKAEFLRKKKCAKFGICPASEEFIEKMENAKDAMPSGSSFAEKYGNNFPH